MNDGLHSIHSMTGFSTRTFSFLDQTYKVELKSLNHRFLEIKLRTPREWASFEAALRLLVESKLKRGSVEIWVERSSSSSSSNANEIQINSAQAEHAYRVLSELALRFNLTNNISLRDLITFPEVIGKGSVCVLSDAQLAELKSILLSEVSKGIDELVKMRAQEGAKLQSVLLAIVEQFKAAHSRFLNLRDHIRSRAQEKIRKRIEQCFEAFTTPDAQMRALMETRIAQEISYALDKLDIEEELTRFIGHVDEVEKIFRQGGLVGKKLDFMFQELNREINTLGNKAQDLDVSQDVISLKMWVEQMREQSLNLE
jgi:uncharacterized protein (TIGR00255 family)